MTTVYRVFVQLVTTTRVNLARVFWQGGLTRLKEPAHPNGWGFETWKTLINLSSIIRRYALRHAAPLRSAATQDANLEENHLE